MVGVCGDYPVYVKIYWKDKVIVKGLDGQWRCMSHLSDISNCYDSYFVESSEVRESVESWWDGDKSYATCQ